MGSLTPLFPRQYPGESYLLSQPDLPLGSTVLKVAHHGAKQGTSQRLLEAVQPQVAVVSVGVGNRYGHPNPEVLDATTARRPR